MLEEEVDFDSKVGRKSIDLDNKPYHCNFYYCPNENCHQMPNINLVFKDGLKIKINCDYCKEEKELTFDEFFAEVNKEKNNKMICTNEQKEGARKTETYCTHCQVFLCDDCDTKHRTEQKKHFTMLTDGFKISSKCSEEGCENMIDYFCPKCKVHLCAKHKEDNHKGHKRTVKTETIMPEDKYKIIAKEIFTVKDALDHHLNKIQAVVKQIDELVEKVKPIQEELKVYAKAIETNKDNIYEFLYKLNEAYLLTNKVQNYPVLNNLLQNRMPIKIEEYVEQRIEKIEELMLNIKKANREPYFTAIYDTNEEFGDEGEEELSRKLDIFTSNTEHPFKALNKKNCDMWIDDKPTEFTKKLKTEGMHTVTVSMKVGEYLTTAESMFSGCNSLKSLKFGDFVLDHAEAINHLCANCYLLESVDMSKQKNEIFTNMRSMFNGCNSLRELEISKDIKTKNVTDMGNLFWGCKSIEELHLPTWSTESLTTALQMFRGCTQLRTLELGPNFNVSKVRDKNTMFDKCKKLDKEFIDKMINN